MTSLERINQVIKDELGKEQRTEAVDVDLLASKIRDLFIDNATVGGVYCVRITKVAGKEIRFKYKKRNGKFVDDDGFVLIKIGRAVNYDKRFASFGFEYNVVFKVNGDSNMEDWLKKKIQPNFMKRFLPRTSARDFKDDSGFQKKNPGPTEWRVVSKQFYNKLKNVRHDVNNLDYQTTFDLLCDDSNYWDIDGDRLKVYIGDVSYINERDVIVFNYESAEEE